LRKFLLQAQYPGNGRFLLGISRGESSMKHTALLVGAAVAATVAITAGTAQADEKWWPAKYYNLDSGSPKIEEYTPLEKASKPWNICVLFPHMKDTFWVAVDYGVVEEAKRMGVNMTLYQAGGYENLPQQLAQFDDCMAGNFDAIVVGPISEAGLTRAIRKATEAGKPVISTVNPLPTAPATARMFVDFTAMVEQTGKFLADDLHGKPANVVNFPGPAGSGWAEQFNQGFKNAIKSDSSIKLLGRSSAIAASRCNSA
jgi:protein TorT